NEKYLMVGYSKRLKEPGKTKLGRDPMGRKGIGKLSVFSIADTVEVYSIKNGEYNGLRMSRADIQAHIDKDRSHDYFPEPLERPKTITDEGTTILLKNLKAGLSTAEAFLRKRLARRFSIIGAEYNFDVSINGDPISAKDRDYYSSIEFLWYLGDASKKFVG